MQGIIIALFPSRGFGFIRGIEDGESRFFHVSVVEPEGAFENLYEDDRVDFEDMDTGAKGLRATWVKKVENATEADTSTTHS